MPSLQLVEGGSDYLEARCCKEVRCTVSNPCNGCQGREQEAQHTRASPACSAAANNNTAARQVQNATAEAERIVNGARQQGSKRDGHLKRRSDARDAQWTRHNAKQASHEQK